MGSEAEETQLVGFIGLGMMGKPIAQRLMTAGHRLMVSDVSRGAAADLESGGARFADDAATVAGAARVIFLSLPGPKEVEQVVLGPKEIIEAARPGDVVVDLSTSSHTMAVALASRLAASGVAYLDAPVSGGSAGAANGTLAVMVGGDAAALETVSPLMASFSARVFHAGPAGMGTIAKLVNNQIFLTASTAVQEGFVMAAKAGLESTKLLEIIQASSAAGYAGLAPIFFGRAFDTALFRLSLAAKDLDLALQTASDLGVPMPTSRGAAEVYHDAIAKGLGDKVFYATLAALERDAGAEVAVPAAKAP